MIKLHLSKQSLQDFLLVSYHLIIYELSCSLPFTIYGILIGLLQNPFILSSYGLFNMFYSCFFVPIVFSLCEVQGSLLSRNYGSKSYTEMIINGYKTLFIGFIFLIISFLTTHTSNFILGFISNDQQLIKNTYLLIKLCYLPNCIFSLGLIILTYLVSQNVISQLFGINVLKIIFVNAFGYLFINYIGMNQYGIVPVKYLEHSLSFIYYLFLLRNKANKQTLGYLQDKQQLFQGMKQFLKKVFYSVLAVYGEFIAFEMNTLITAKMNDIQELAVWVAYVNITSIFFFICLGINQTFRTSIGQLIGQKKYQEAKQESIAYIFYTFILSLILSIILLVIKGRWSALFIKEECYRKKLEIGLLMFAFFMFFQLILFAMFSMCRLINEDKFLFKIMTFFYPVFSGILGYFLCFTFHLGVIGLFISIQLATVIASLLFLKKIYMDFDWEKFDYHSGDDEKKEKLIELA